MTPHGGFLKFLGNQLVLQVSGPVISRSVSPAATGGHRRLSHTCSKVLQCSTRFVHVRSRSPMFVTPPSPPSYTILPCSSIFVDLSPHPPYMVFLVRPCSSMIVHVCQVRPSSSKFVQVRPCSSMFVYLLPHPLIYGSSMFVHVRPGSSRFVQVRPCSSMFVQVRPCSSMFVRYLLLPPNMVRPCSSMFVQVLAIDVKYSYLTSLVSPCSSMFVSVRQLTLQCFYTFHRHSILC